MDLGYVKRDTAVKFAEDAIKIQLTRLVEEALIKSVKPKIKELAKEAVATYNDIRVEMVQDAEDVFSPPGQISKILVTFVEEVINKRYDSPTVVEERN